MNQEIDQYFVCVQENCEKSHKVMGNMKEAQVHWGHKCLQLTDIISQMKSQEVKEKFESISTLRNLVSQKFSEIIEKIQNSLIQKQQECEKFISGLEDPLINQRLLYKELIKDQPLNITKLKKFDQYWLQLLDQNYKPDNFQDFKKLMVDNLSTFQDDLINTIKLNQLSQQHQQISKSALQKQCDQLKLQVIEFQKEDENNKSKLLQQQKEISLLRYELEKAISQLQIIPLNYEWDINKKNGVVINGLNIKAEGSTDSNRFILSKQPIPQKKCYFEIIKHKNDGCYDSFGLCINRKIGIRNGQDNQGWALRLRGPASDDFKYIGCIHNGQSQKFFNDWKENDRIGILYDPQKKSMTYYRNGISLGTPFTNVEGQLFICLEVCCNDSDYTIVKDPQVKILS